MNSPEPAISPALKRGGFKRKLTWVILACFALALVVFVIWRLWLASAIHAQVAAIHKEGLPVDWKDLQHWPVALADDQNAALIFDRAFETAETNSCYRISRLDLPVRRAPFTNRYEVFECVRSNNAAMKIIYGITNAANCRYPINYMEGPVALLPHLAKLKNFAELFAGDALLKADQHDPAGAVQDIEASIKLSRSLDAEPLLLSQLVSVAVLAITTQSLERTLARTSLSDAQLSQLAEDLGEAEATNRFWTGMVGERASGGEMLRLLNDDPRAFVIMANKMSAEFEQTDVLPRYNNGLLIRCSGFWLRDRHFFLRAIETDIAAFAVPPPASLRFTNELNNIETNARKGFYMMSSMLLPAFSKVVIRDADVRAGLRTAIVGLALERWRAAHDQRIPDSLGELVPDFLPAIPADPYDGQPLRFKKLPKGCVVYSIGPNGQDDGGKERIYSIKVSLEERNRYDITFIIEK
jgi:hypothetical protein